MTLITRGVAGNADHDDPFLVPGNMANILIVDDDPDIREALAAVLDHAGYDTFTACDGEEALRRLQERRADVVLLDLMMPRMDGLSLVRALKADPALESIPVIVASAAPITEPAPGVRAYLVKPFDLGRLLDVVGYLAQT